MTNRKDLILRDFKIACQSRHCSLVGWREVFSGKAKFGIFGDGKEVAQMAMANSFRPGDWRSGYYRDQTFMMAIGGLTVRQFFSQLFAECDIELEPHSAGRQMNNHPSTRLIDANGKWIDQLSLPITSADISPTGGQMPRALGLAWASKVYRKNKRIKSSAGFSKNGEEISFATIGNASTSEGLFWESINAAAVLQVPLLVSVWDDGYGISVPAEYQTVKQSISVALQGFEVSQTDKGLKIFKVKGWDYEALCEVYRQATDLCRRDHTPCLVHVIEMTQPQGHSTSGSHERYKTKERLTWESEFDCLSKMSEWIVKSKIATEAELKKIDSDALAYVEHERTSAWEVYTKSIQDEKDSALTLIQEIAQHSDFKSAAESSYAELKRNPTLLRRSILSSLRRLKYQIGHISSPQVRSLQLHIERLMDKYRKIYSSNLMCESAGSSLSIPEVKPTFDKTTEKVDGRQVIQKFFETKMSSDPRIVIFGEDVGQIGGTNLEFDGLQEKFGVESIFDTGIREATILGQGIGGAMRGLRPIADIQYLDYLLFCLQGMSDDLATLQYRSAGGQRCPLIVRTKGHRLEGIWHSGSPMGSIINSIRGVHVCVPRNMTQAAGMYNTLLQSDDPALVIEVLNGYRLKEVMPKNLGEYTVPLGQPEILRNGEHVTLVTYGACVKIALDAAELLVNCGIELEVIDIQTLLPFDRHKKILESLKRTHALVCLDEDVPGGASAYMMQQILVEGSGFEWLDSKPVTISAQHHRPAYGSDGDYFSKPSAEDVYESIYQICHERKPHVWPAINGFP